jgi:sugar lactone lactonase YvrE
MKSMVTLVASCLLAWNAALAIDQYELTAESTTRNLGAPAGKLEAFAFAESKVFAGTSRDCWLTDGPRISGLSFGPERHAYAAVPIPARGMSRPSPIAGGITRPNGIALDPKNGVLYVSEYGGNHLWQFSFNADGLLSGGERHAVITTLQGKPDSGGDGMVVDGEGRAYVTSYQGIQVFKDGVLLGTYPKPQDKATVSAAVSGKALYVCSSDKVFKAPLFGRLK